MVLNSYHCLPSPLNQKANGNEFGFVHLDLPMPLGADLAGSGVSFYYHMYGFHTGDLTLSVSSDGTT